MEYRLKTEQPIHKQESFLKNLGNRVITALYMKCTYLDLKIAVYS
jgi:hypothetical protein